jgi:TM2 domain-containing membrane protein YozV
LDVVVLRALEKEPSRRYQRVSEIKTDLQRLTPGAGAAGSTFAAVPMPFSPPAYVPTPPPVTPYNQPPFAPTPAGMYPRVPTPMPAAPPSQPPPPMGPIGPAWRSMKPATAGQKTPTGFTTFATAPSSPGAPYAVPAPSARNVGIAYLCWCLCFVSFCGIHRFYAGKWISGFIWLLTGGCLFIGQIIDLALIPGMIRKANEQHMPWVPGGAPPKPPMPPQPLPPTPPAA